MLQKEDCGNQNSLLGLLLVVWKSKGSRDKVQPLAWTYRSRGSEILPLFQFLNLKKIVNCIQKVHETQRHNFLSFVKASSCLIGTLEKKQNIATIPLSNHSWLLSLSCFSLSFYYLNIHLKMTIYVCLFSNFIQVCSYFISDLFIHHEFYVYC